mmetsp:Transcript_86517/g.239902  ORF Transcript_86517/g.239902 Transcript_86517/m.239902 type:complete len:248 (+) Transcript_86517:23-766(+)
MVGTSFCARRALQHCRERGLGTVWGGPHPLRRQSVCVPRAPSTVAVAVQLGALEVSGLQEEGVPGPQRAASDAAFVLHKVPGTARVTVGLCALADPVLRPVLGHLAISKLPAVPVLLGHLLVVVPLHEGEEAAGQAEGLLDLPVRVPRVHLLARPAKVLVHDKVQAQAAAGIRRIAVAAAAAAAAWLLFLLLLLLLCLLAILKLRLLLGEFLDLLGLLLCALLLLLGALLGLLLLLLLLFRQLPLFL